VVHSQANTRTDRGACYFYHRHLFTTADYDRIVGFIKRQMPREKAKALGVSKHIMLTSFGRLFRAYATILFITFANFLSA
jgi:hypothetical protein